eukprot:4608296-Pleurochrysis_carterae.AAC.2
MDCSVLPRPCAEQARRRVRGASPRWGGRVGSLGASLGSGSGTIEQEKRLGTSVRTQKRRQVRAAAGKTGSRTSESGSERQREER